MGFNVSILACKYEDKSNFLRMLKYSKTGVEVSEYDCALSGAHIGDHYLVWVDWREAELIDDRECLQIAMVVPFISLDVSETTMFSSARFWKDGQLAWSAIASDGDGIPLKTAGCVPKVLDEITRNHRAEVAAGDDPEELDFEIPVALFQKLTTYRYDEVGDVKFVELQKQISVSRAWWKFW
jgi:hypothetical protein